MKNAEIIRAINHAIRIQIITHLLMFKELSMTELSKKLKRSKSTIHRHLKILMEENITNVSKEVKVRGSINAKYYKLTDKFMSYLKLDKKSNNIQIEKIIRDDSELEDFINRMEFLSLITIKSLEKFKTNLEIYHDIMKSNSQQVFNEINKINPFGKVIFLSKNDYEELNDKLKEFHSILNRTSKKKMDISENVKKPYIFTYFLLNLDNLLQLTK